MSFQADALPLLIGSLPMQNHALATRLMLKYTPEIPLWIQLPGYAEERLLSQFSACLPGIRGEGDHLYLDTATEAFSQELLAFFEEYMAVFEGERPVFQSRFALKGRAAQGFEAFFEVLSRLRHSPVAVKGQITGPFTLLTGLKDQEGRIAYYNQELREAIVKAVAMQARYQMQRLKGLSDQVILFLDEPALAGFGSSALVSIQKEEVITQLNEVIEEVHREGGLAGIHVCANTDWGMVFSTGIDILSFDAFGFFDRMLLFKDQVHEFIERGGVVAWGLVPTLNQEDLVQADVEGLLARWQSCVQALGLNLATAQRQSLLTPSCGTGCLSLELAIKAMDLTRELSLAIRSL